MWPLNLAPSHPQGQRSRPQDQVSTRASGPGLLTCLGAHGKPRTPWAPAPTVPREANEPPHRPGRGAWARQTWPHETVLGAQVHVSQWGFKGSSVMMSCLKGERLPGDLDDSLKSVVLGLSWWPSGESICQV